MPKPLIALPAAHLTHKGRVPDYEINEMYIKAVLSAGGLPVILPTNYPRIRLAAIGRDFRWVFV